MCGIVGTFEKNQAGPDMGVLRKMCGALQHRGPDDEGYFTAPGLGLGMRRLSIIDVAGGHQPLFNEDKSLVLVFNGEVYNYRELSAPLLKKGHKFSSQSDGEVILHLYEENGLALLDDLNGMYAFCLWDVKKQQGFLVRDRIGIKPLYYAAQDGRLLFASELKALLSALPRPSPDTDALLAYMNFMYIPGEQTPFQGIRKLPKASVLSFGLQGAEPPRRYWRLDGGPAPALDFSRAKEEFLSLMRSSIELQSRSDVPVGVFLSGGIDSSLIAAFFSQQTKSAVHSFNVKYSNASFDESAYAEQVARRFGCLHKSIEVGLDDFRKELPRLIWHMDEPSADHALVAAYKVSELASRDVKVVLNGSGGDELFGGYPRHLPNHPALSLWHHTPAPLQNVAAALVSVAPDLRAKLLSNRSEDDTYLWRLMQFKPFHLEGFETSGRSLPRRHPVLENILREAPAETINRRLFIDAHFYLVDDLLLLLDKMTMAASVEGRVPLLDHRLVEWAFRLPGDWKVRGTQLKSGLKEWLRGVIPDEVLDRPKLGFGAPIRDWMDHGLQEICERFVAARPAGRSGLYWGLRGEALRRKMKSLNFQQNYALLVLEIWFKMFIDGQTPEEVSREMGA